MSAETNGELILEPCYIVALSSPLRMVKSCKEKAAKAEKHAAYKPLAGGLTNMRTKEYVKQIDQKIGKKKQEGRGSKGEKEGAYTSRARLPERS
ncbi:hypothetical protein ACE1TI_05745 [Alteribacillus sp. JSM 102045]|uniref:hypothetical protein n=1 Tax=Alteribacillus sp. JSM 102045 TaxID=1562101 RepID=UPI0035BF025B